MSTKTCRSRGRDWEFTVCVMVRDGIREDVEARLDYRQQCGGLVQSAAAPVCSATRHCPSPSAIHRHNRKLWFEASKRKPAMPTLRKRSSVLERAKHSRPMRRKHKSTFVESMCRHNPCEATMTMGIVLMSLAMQSSAGRTYMCGYTWK